MLTVISWTSIVSAGDFDWTKDFNLRAEADPSGFRARLAARFRIGDVEIHAVLSNVENPADAYLIFRLGEMSSHSPEYVMKRYRSEKGRGWGVIAKSLGIKPGSSEFHKLKQSDDLYGKQGDMKHGDKNTAKGNNGKIKK